jgi:hypothetical protein
VVLHACSDRKPAEGVPSAAPAALSAFALVLMLERGYMQLRYIALAWRNGKLNV